MERDVGPMDELEEVCIDEQDTAKVIKIGKNLEAAVRALLVEFLRRNLDIAAWPHNWLRPMQRLPQQPPAQEAPEDTARPRSPPKGQTLGDQTEVVATRLRG